MTKLIVALDKLDPEENCELIRQTHKLVDWYKIGSITMPGIPEIFELIGAIGDNTRSDGMPHIMWDFKYCDIPDTVSRAVENLLRSDYANEGDMVTVMAREGCIAAALEGASGYLRILGVPMLTSDPTYLPGDILSATDRILGLRAHGVVMPSTMTETIREKFEDAIIVCPGISLDGNVRDSHRHVGTPEFAAKHGADFIVMGRSLWGDDDIVGTIGKVKEQLKSE